MYITESSVKELEERLEKTEKLANDRADFILRWQAIGNLSIPRDTTAEDQLLLMQCNISVAEVIEINV